MFSAHRLAKMFGLVAATFLISGNVLAQTQFLIADRDSDAIFRVRDLNNDGVLTPPGEVFLWFSGANAAGTPAPGNPNAIDVSLCRLAIIGDQTNGQILWAADLNNDGDAEDALESGILAGPGNSAGLSFAFPTGAAFNANCIAHVVNASNAFGPDAIYRLQDLNGDGDAMDEVNGAHEATVYVGVPVFGDNSSYSPQEIFFDSNNVGYLRNSSANLHGVYRFEDLNNDGDAHDPANGKVPAEFTVFFNAANASGVAIGAGLGMDVNRFPTGHASMYVHNLASGGVDQLIRLIDLNDDGDAQDAGEAALVWSYATSGFTSVDVVSLNNGDVLVTDNSGLTVALLRDLNSDGDFMDANEQTIYFASDGTVQQVRGMARLCRPGDVNCDGPVNVDDLLGVINSWGFASCNSADIDCNEAVNVDDLLTVINNWGD